MPEAVFYIVAENPENPQVAHYVKQTHVHEHMREERTQLSQVKVVQEPRSNKAVFIDELFEVDCHTLVGKNTDIGDDQQDVDDGKLG